MSKRGIVLSVGIVALVLGLCLGRAGLLNLSVAHAADAPTPVASGGNGPEKAIVSTAEFMKLLIDPTYDKLRDAVENAPEKRAQWRALYVASFSLAELNNLYYSRGDKDFMKTPEWAEHCKLTQDLSVKLAESIRAQSDYATVKANYMAVMKNCNDCHRKFKPGEIDEIMPPASWGVAPSPDAKKKVVQ